MAIEYELIKADIFKIDPNFPNKKFAFLAKGTDGKIYHIKPNWKDCYNNVNEYIAHHVGSLMQAPILRGCFLKINKENMQKWEAVVNSFHPSLVFPTFLPPSDEAVFFGVEFCRNASHAASARELSSTIKSASNKDSFYAQFPYDQYLKNPDRHLYNHILMKDKHKVLFYLIDFDRIFCGAVDWSRVASDMNDFNCFNLPGYNVDLYPLVNNEQIKIVHNYAAMISNIEDLDIDDICQTISIIYKIHKNDLVIIAQWLKHRRSEIYSRCLENEKCFTSVTQRGLNSVSRQYTD